MDMFTASANTMSLVGTALFCTMVLSLALMAYARYKRDQEELYLLQDTEESEATWRSE
jgi:ABC-type Fe3+ transport system permease subunit